jgi:hypothetical protein
MVNFINRTNWIFFDTYPLNTPSNHFYKLTNMDLLLYRTILAKVSNPDIVRARLAVGANPNARDSD